MGFAIKTQGPTPKAQCRQPSCLLFGVTRQQSAAGVRVSGVFTDDRLWENR